MTLRHLRGGVALAGTAADFVAANPVLLERQVSLETDTGIEKIGDGTTHYADLTAVPAPGGDSDLAKQVVLYCNGMEAVGERTVSADVITSWGAVELTGEATFTGTDGHCGVEGDSVAGVNQFTFARVQLIVQRVRNEAGAVVQEDATVAAAVDVPSGDLALFTEFTGESAHVARGSAHGLDDTLLWFDQAGTYLVRSTFSGPVVIAPVA